MKNNWTLIYNPFTKIDGWQAFFIGLVVALLSGVIGTFANVAFDGALDAHLTQQITYKESFILLLISIITTTIVLYLAGIIVAKNVRFIDILGTTLLARTPYLLFAVAGLAATPIATADLIANPAIVFTNLGYLLLTLLGVPITVWVIALLFHAFRVSTGAKGTKLIIAFIVAILVAEILSKVCIQIIFNHL